MNLRHRLMRGLCNAALAAGLSFGATSHAVADTYCHGLAHSNTYGNSHSDIYADADSNSNRNGDSDAHSYIYTNA